MVKSSHMAKIKRIMGEIRSKVSVDDVLAKYNCFPVTGRNVYRCPFHGEDKRPSASTEKKVLHCFTCGESWDSVGIVQKFENCGVWKAIKIVDGLFSLGLFGALSKEEIEARKEREIQIELKEKKKKEKENFINKTANDILEKIRIWEEGQKLFHPTRGEVRNANWKNSRMFFYALKEQQRLEWLYYKILNFNRPESEFDYIYGEDREQILKKIMGGEIVI